MFFFSFTVQWLFLNALQTPTILRSVKRLDLNLHLDEQRMKHAIKPKIININHTLVFIHTFKNTADLSKSSVFCEQLVHKIKIFALGPYSPHKEPKGSFRWNTVCSEGLTHLTGNPKDRFGEISVRKALVTSHGTQLRLVRWNICSEGISQLSHRLPNGTSFSGISVLKPLVTTKGNQQIVSVDRTGRKTLVVSDIPIKSDLYLHAQENQFVWFSKESKRRFEHEKGPPGPVLKRKQHEQQLVNSGVPFRFCSLKICQQTHVFFFNFQLKQAGFRLITEDRRN